MNQSFYENSADEYFGDEGLRPYLSYEKKSKAKEPFQCIYCGNFADSREHLPSKVFLDEPYPLNLTILPSCVRCNTAYSLDEEFVACFIEVMRSEILGIPIQRGKILKIFEHTPALYNHIKDIVFSDGEIRKNLGEEYISRFTKVVSKLVCGHLMYEMSEFVNDMKEVKFKWINQLSSQQLNGFFSPVPCDKSPEIGSRGFENIFISGQGEILDYSWETVQENNYRFLVSPNITRIVIRDVFLVEMTHW